MGAPIILLVEDESLIRELLAAEFTDVGFEIVAADDGNRAVAELEANVDRFKAVVTDIKLGRGPNGWDVARRARELIPDIPVLYITGDSMHEWSSMGVPASALVAKPFTPMQVSTTLVTLVTAADARRTI
jgi:CheY-like chemotaxis protein